jgi:anti-sigma factor RsiW
MHPIDPAELSAFLDGELPAKRAEEVRAALALDPALRQSFEQLVALDADWKERAATAMFRPRVQLEAAPSAGRFRVAAKALPSLYGAGLDALLLALVVGWGLVRILRTTDADRRQSAVPTGY